jgi:hypothetical protein
MASPHSGSPGLKPQGHVKLHRVSRFHCNPQHKSVGTLRLGGSRDEPETLW